MEDLQMRQNLYSIFSIIIVLTAIILIGGCASGVQKMRKLNPGMSPSDIDQIMGKRDSFSTVEKNGDIYILYQYTNQFCNAHVSIYEKCDFFVIFRNNQLIETGVKNVRSNMPKMQFIHLFQY